MKRNWPRPLLLTLLLVLLALSVTAIQASQANLEFSQSTLSPSDTAVPSISPTPTTIVVPAGVLLYTVKVDDTAVSIALAFHTDIKTLRDLNPEIQFLNCDFSQFSGGSDCTLRPPLTAGQRLRVPALAGTPESTQSAVSVQAGAVFVQLGFHGLIEIGGLRVGEIRQGSPAQRSGLRTGDLIIRVNNQTYNVQDVTGTLLPLITNLRPVLTVMRDGQQITILVAPAVAVLTATPTPIRLPTVVPLPPQRTQLGVGYDIVTAGLASQLKLSVNNGALITSVVPRSSADLAGIKVGDVITAVDGDKVDAKHTLLLRMMPYNVGDTVTLTLVRGTETIEVSVTLVQPGRASNSTG